MEKIHGIHEIFQRNKDGSYNQNALVYQDILKYFLVPKGDHSNNDSFRFWDLAKWLMEHNQEFVNYYRDLSTRNTTMSNRIEARKGRIRSKLDDLINLDLIQISGTTKASTTNANIDLYRYTENGRLIAWLIQSMDPKKCGNADNEIYKILYSHFKENGSSDSLFYVNAFRMMKEGGVFGNFANLLRQVLYDGKPIRNISDLLSAVRTPKHLIETGTKNPGAIIEYFHQIIKGMDLAQRKLFFYHMKTSIEERMQKSLCEPAKYEKLRFEIRDKPWLVAIEGICKECKCPVHIAIETLGYLETKFVPLARLTQDCPHCKKENSIVIPLFSNFSMDITD